MNQSGSSFQTAVPEDPGLPSLGLALDPAQALPLLQMSDLPGRATSCRIQYIRYKPNTNCIVLYEVSLSDGKKISAYAKLFAVDRVPRASDELLLSKYYADRQIAVAVFPRDLQMPALRLAMMPDQASTLLKGAVGRAKHTRFDRNWSNWLPIRYKPERRCVMLGEYDAQEEPADHGPGRRFYARFYASPRAEIYARWYQHFQTLTGKRVRTPRFIGYSRKNRLLLLKKLAGSPLSSFFDQPETDLGRAVDAASAALETWHRLAPPAGTPALPQTGDQLREYARILEVLLPGRSPSPVTLADELVATAPEPGEACLLHGDFYYDQILVSRYPLARFLDLDSLALGDPVLDVASFCAQLRLLANRGKLDSQRADWICRRFIEGYQSASGGRIHNQRLQWHTTALLLKLSIWPFRRFEDSWPERTSRMVSEAFEWGRSVQC